MALLQVNTYSQSLSRIITFHIILPNDAPPEMIAGNPHYERTVKTLYLLHGFSGSSMDWLTGSLIQELSLKYNLAVVMPAGENSFYLNGKGTGRAYETFTGEELMDYCKKTFGLSDRKEDNFIGGLSMGGFGAIHTALKYPQRFGKMFGLSSALIINGIKGMKPGTKDFIADYDYYTQVFGDLDKLDESENNPEHLITERKKKGETIQPVFLACGSEDFLIKENQEFRDFLIKEGVDVVYRESTGVHDWKFWNEYLEPAIQWALQPPVIPEEMVHGDMPGDKVEINEGHVQKANVIFKELLPMLTAAAEKAENGKVVLTVCGGSGVGKSEIASLLSFYLKEIGIGSYTLSGDNYPHRIPVYNDAERLHIFRESALKGMVKEGVFDAEHFRIIHEFQKNGDDANPEHAREYDWYESYLKNGKEGLKGYLGTANEIGFDEVEEIVRQFKSGAEQIWLKRMGREDTELWYEKVDFSNIQVLIIEWTHGNSDHYKGVDIPILLNSTPQETLAHRRARNRDGATDSPFTMMVLELEQAMLKKQASKAKIIISKSGELLSYEDYCRQMEEGSR